MNNNELTRECSFSENARFPEENEHFCKNKHGTSEKNIGYRRKNKDDLF